MLNSKKSVAVLMLSTFTLSNANAQFFDLTDQGAQTEIIRPTGNYQSSAALPEGLEHLAADTVEFNPDLETSGDEGGFIPAQDPDANSTKQESFTTMPVSGFGSFADQDTIVEEEVSNQVRTIAQLDNIGYLDANFDEALWLGVSYDYAKARFANFKDIKSVHVKNIVKNMLMAKARAPQSENSWYALRLQTLHDMGNLSDVKLLLKEVKAQELSQINNKQLNALYIKAYMLEENTLDFIRTALETDSSNLDYKKALLINFYSNAMQNNQIRLTFNALKDQDSTVAESNFGKLYAALINKTEFDAKDLKNLDTYDQYVIALNPTLFKNVDYSKFTDLTLLQLVKNAINNEDKVRYAEVLMNKYPFSYNVETLTSLYSNYSFEAKDLSTPLNFINKSDNEIEKRALLFQASKLNGLNSTKALSLKKLWESYDASKLSNIKYLINDRTQGVAINSSIAWFSIDLLKNEIKQAQLEPRVLKTLYENIDNAYSNSNILNLQIAVEFLRQTSVLSNDFDSIQEYKETLQAWFKANKINSQADYDYVLKVLTLLDALEAPIPDEMWVSVYENSKYASSRANAVSPVWLRLITSSIQKEEKGKALLLVAEKFADSTAANMEAQTLANIIATLNFLNMPQDMALIGVDAIVK
jgi:hypothetical protein